MPQLSERLRPDRSKVLLRFKDETFSGLIFQPLTDPVNNLTTELVMELLGSCIASSIPTFMSIPTKPGYCSALVELNGPLKAAVATRNLQNIKAKLLEAIAFGSQSLTDLEQPEIHS